MKQKLFAVKIHAPNWDKGVWRLYLHTLFENEQDARKWMAEWKKYSESKHESKLLWKVTEAEIADLPFSKIVAKGGKP